MRSKGKSSSFKGVTLYNILGTSRQQLGKLEEAIDAFKKAVSIKPDYVEAHYNMGNALQEQGKLEEAIEAYKKALSKKPDYTKAFFNMGNALQEQGKLEQATVAYKKATLINPNYAEAYNNMGAAFKKQEKLAESLEHINAIFIKPNFDEAYYNMGNVLKGLTFHEPNRDLQKRIASLLDKKKYVRPKDIAKAISLLKLELFCKNTCKWLMMK